MSLYPVPVVGDQGLYDSSSTAKHNLGVETSFNTDAGIVYARYMKNGNAASLPAGHIVAYQLDVDAGPYACDTAGLAVSKGISPNQIAGVMCASMTVGGFGWVAFKGPVTAHRLAASVASNVASMVTANSAAVGAVQASSLAFNTASAVQANALVIGQLGATASTISRTLINADAGAYLNLFWR